MLAERITLVSLGEAPLIVDEPELFGQPLRVDLSGYVMARVTAIIRWEEGAAWDTAPGQVGVLCFPALAFITDPLTGGLPRHEIGADSGDAWLPVAVNLAPTGVNQDSFTPATSEWFYLSSEAKADVLLQAATRGGAGEEPTISQLALEVQR